MQSAKPNSKTAIYALQKYKARISRSTFIYYCSLWGLVVHTKPKRRKKKTNFGTENLIMLQSHIICRILKNFLRYSTEIRLRNSTSVPYIIEGIH